MAPKRSLMWRRALPCASLLPVVLVSCHQGKWTSDQVDCQHGAYDASTSTCKCYDGWSNAGVTDTIRFFEGVCDQYNCQSDELCQEELGIPGATCPVKGWNCYCGWGYAIRNAWHGWETHGRQGGAACMGVMYTFSFWATGWVEFLVAHSWKAVLLLAALSLPFGRKRVNCDHHVPSMWKSLRDACGCPPRCHGQCLMTERYTFVAFKDDVAWTLYVLDLGIWAYTFLAVLWILTLFIWSLVLWILVILTCMAVTVAGVCTACGDGAASVDCCGCDTASDAGCTQCCAHGCCALEAPHAGAGSLDVFYWGGPFPYDPVGCYWYGCDDGAGPGGSTGCSNVWFCCWPLAWLFFVFPTPPENAWGGLSGFLFGTHALTAPERLYQGGNSVVEFFRMGWRRGSDLHANDAWRRQVYDFLAGEWQAPPSHSAAPDSASEEELPQTLVPLTQADGELRTVIPVGRCAHAVCIGRPFEKSRDGCVDSSFQDYSENMCWICQDTTHQEFDLWLSCHHIFCSKCSSEMLQRRMPCPLCRVASSIVLRGTSAVARGGLPTLLPRSSSRRSHSEKCKGSQPEQISMVPHM